MTGESSRSPVRIIAAGAVALILLGVGFGIGGASRQHTVDHDKTLAGQDRATINSLKSDTQSIQRSADSLQLQFSHDEQMLQHQRDKIANLTSQQDALAARKTQLDQRSAGLDQRSAGLDQRKAQLDAQQASLDGQQAAIDANSFSDGLYQVGADIQAGQYHTDGGDTCYWAKLSTSDTSSYIDNNLSAGPQTVTIDSPYFDSEGCGTWTKVG